MSAAFQRVVQQNQLALREGAKIIRNIIATTPAPTGFTTHELYNLALKEAPPPDYEPLPQPTTPPPPKPVYRKGKILKKDMPVPPHPEHPVRSLSFLKQSILPFLSGQMELKKTQAQRLPTNSTVARKKKGKQAQDATAGTGPATETVWVWQPVDKSTLPTPFTPKPPKKVFGADVGVGEDLTHLSKRRERARRQKIRADVHAMKVAEGIARQKARSAAGAELRRKQAEKAARNLKREEERKAALEASASRGQAQAQTTPQDPDTKERLEAVAKLFAKRKAADAASRGHARQENPSARGI